MNIFKNDTKNFLSVLDQIKQEKETILGLVEEMKVHYKKLKNLRTKVNGLQEELKLKGVAKNIVELIE